MCCPKAVVSTAATGMAIVTAVTGWMTARATTATTAIIATIAAMAATVS